MRSAPWEKGSKTGIRRYTASREKEDTDAMFPVLKKADCRRKREKREMRASARVRARYWPVGVEVVLGRVGDEVEVYL